jgi:hypothetical protein
MTMLDYKGFTWINKDDLLIFLEEEELIKDYPDEVKKYIFSLIKTFKNSEKVENDNTES